VGEGRPISAAAFWDASALVPLCIQQNGTAAAERLIRKFGVVVWWATSVEMRSAFVRMVRTGHLTASGRVQAQVVLGDLRSIWREIAPNPSLRDRAEQLLDRFPLKAADAFQLAAALAWTTGRPHGRPFVSGDTQLLAAARELGFHVLEI
jgi:predicted nucleic acid-binding protein